MWFSKTKAPVPLKLKDGSLQALRGLALRLSLSPEPDAPRMVAFMSARKGEGTTTLAAKYATLLCTESGKRVLLIDASVTPGKMYVDLGLKNKAGIIDAALENMPMESVVAEINPKLMAARWMGKPEHRANSIKMMQNPEFWNKLKTDFEYIVIDNASLNASYDGIVLAAKADATVLVVEAEATPTPVTQKLRDTLMEAGAKIAGAVLTKRKFYIPQSVYKKL